MFKALKFVLLALFLAFALAQKEGSALRGGEDADLIAHDEPSDVIGEMDVTDPSDQRRGLWWYSRPRPRPRPRPKYYRPKPRPYPKPYSPWP